MGTPPTLLKTLIPWDDEMIPSHVHRIEVEAGLQALPLAASLIICGRVAIVSATDPWTSPRADSRLAISSGPSHRAHSLPSDHACPEET